MRTTLGITLTGLALVLSACSAPATDSASAAEPASATQPTAPTINRSATPSAVISQSAAPSVEPGSPSPPASEVATMSPEPFTLTSTAFLASGAIPRRFTCDGENVSPDLAWAGAPEGAKALVLVVIDPDAHNFVHWLVYDMTGSPAGGLPLGISASPDAPPQGSNGFGKVGYGGPCPPSGTHHYRFTLTALDKRLELTGTPRIDALQAAMTGHILAAASLTGTYRRS